MCLSEDDRAQVILFVDCERQIVDRIRRIQLEGYLLYLEKPFW